MLLQNTLDLSTFEIVRFRIWNQTSQPSDRGFGSKYFNTNSGHEAYCREEIFTPIGWRKTAYMDDIDKINEKLDLIFGDELDTDTIIDSWKEVQDFLSGIEDTKNLMTMLDGKLDKKGGTITGNLTINQRLNMGSYIRFNQYNEEAEYMLGMTYAGGPLGWYNGSTWKTIAFTDSTVGAAKKLETAVSLWGNTFDGTQSLDKSITFAYGGAFLKGKTSEGGVFTFAKVNEINELLLGQGTAQLGAATAIYGKKIIFCYGSAGSISQTAMTITEEGNVLVGNVAENDGTPLKVSTRIHVSGTNQTAPSLGSAPTSGLLVGTNNLGISEWVNTSGQGNIQVGRFDGTATAYALNLNPLGGAVNIASSGALTNIYGSLCLSGKTLDDARIAFNREGVNYITFPSTGSLAFANDIGAESIILRLDTNRLYPNVTNAVSLGTSSYRWSNVYSTLGDFNGVVTIRSNADGAELLRFSTDRSWKFSQLGTGAATSLCLSPDATSKSFVIADPDTSRVFEFWVNGINSSATFNSVLTVANLAIFSSRVLIGGAVDDRSTALQVNNTMSIGDSGTTYGLRLNRYDVHAWIPENYGYGHRASFGLKIGDTLLGAFAHYRDADGSYFAFIGTAKASPWFTINSTESFFSVATTFNGGALIPTGQTLTIGSVTFRETAAGEVEVDGNLHTTGTLASGGKGEVGENTTGNAMVYQYDLASGESVYTVDNVKGSTNVIVQIFEWNSNTSSWDMILTDVSVKADAITVTFGRTTTVNHMVTVC